MLGRCLLDMKEIRNVVIGTTLFLVIYSLLPAFDVKFSLIFFLFAVGNILVINMVFRVLKFGKASSKRFTEQWYEDQKKGTEHN